MTIVCLLRGCLWRTMLMREVEVTGLQCQCCERCGALRYSHPANVRS
ncbi:hypothetical protein CCOS865_04165 [Pseudomonas reidholzensis]|uniref:Uncharacterized protein n=1 Tax=Pseudomonas reidholzensis TaxID=1785162 RepID=A0A383RYB3_9PSED|nr:PSPA7_2676 family Cys-rich small protein [Pseudomonas reidholzensis]SYX91885.1 hypothetical protein CCOS865_04165 [Pseudomonas reidholzensis]